MRVYLRRLRALVNTQRMDGLMSCHSGGSSWLYPSVPDFRLEQTRESEVQPAAL